MSSSSQRAMKSPRARPTAAFSFSPREWNASRPFEPVHPSEPEQTERLSAGLAELLMDVPFFAPESPKQRVEPQPGCLPATERAQPLHRDLEGLALFVPSPGVGRPRPPHLRSPLWLHVRRDQVTVVVHEEAVQEVVAVWVIAIVLLQPLLLRGGRRHRRRDKSAT